MTLYPDWVPALQQKVDEDVRTEEVCEALWEEELRKRAAAFVETARAEARLSAEARVRASCQNPGRFGCCRQCQPCLQARSRRWVARAKNEWFSHGRCWWITLTYRGSKPAFYTEVQKWMKRVRSTCPSSMRYLISEETGDRFGRLHFHVLLFCAPEVTKRSLTRQWKHGFSKCVLAKTVGVLKYVSKYASKVGRLRASVGFGNSLLAIARARPDLAVEYDQWLFGAGQCPDFVVVFGSVISKHRIGHWWLSPPF